MESRPPHLDSSFIHDADVIRDSTKLEATDGPQGVQEDNGAMEGVLNQNILSSTAALSSMP